MTRAIDGFCLGGAFYMDSDGDFLFFIFIIFLKNQCIYCYVVRKKDQNFLFLLGGAD